MGLGQVRSPKEAEQDPAWQQELQQLRSAGHDLPAAVQSQMGHQRAAHAFQVGKVWFAELQSLSINWVNQVKYWRHSFDLQLAIEASATATGCKHAFRSSIESW